MLILGLLLRFGLYGDTVMVMVGSGSRCGVGPDFGLGLRASVGLKATFRLKVRVGCGWVLV